MAAARGLREVVGRERTGGVGTPVLEGVFLREWSSTVTPSVFEASCVLDCTRWFTVWYWSMVLEYSSLFPFVATVALWILASVRASVLPLPVVLLPVRVGPNSEISHTETLLPTLSHPLQPATLPTLPTRSFPPVYSRQSLNYLTAYLTVTLLCTLTDAFPVLSSSAEMKEASKDAS